MNFESFVLCAATNDLGDEPVARAHADAVEFRMDMAEEPLAALDSYDGELPVVATNRVDWEGGETADTEARLDDLETALAYDAVEAVDVEFAALEGEGEHDATRVVEGAEDAGASVIVSTHDFERMPATHVVVERLERACGHGDVGKLAATARTRADVLDLLAATQALDDAGNPVATMAMGEAGRHSRVVAPLYGSRIGYAPVDPASATAPGQYDLATLAEAIEELRSQD